MGIRDPKQISPYQIFEKLGGGMREVYKAERRHPHQARRCRQTHEVRL